MSLNLDMNTSSYSGITAPFKFDGKDYPLWKSQMLALLAMQGLSEFIVKSPQDIIKDLPIKVVQGGSTSTSNSSKDSKEESKERNMIEETQAKAMKAYGLLLFCLARQQLGLFLDVEQGNPYALWTSLQDMYERKTTASKADTINALYECKMGKDSFDVYVSKIKLLVSRLKSMSEQYSEAQMMHVMFKGLPAIYEPTVQALKIQQNMNFADACKHIRDCQDSIKSKESQEQAVANLAHSGFKGKGKYKGKPNNQNKDKSDGAKKPFSCYTCGKRGHISKDCYKNTKNCSYCKISGHTIEECRKKEQSSSDGVQLFISECKSDSDSTVTQTVADNMAQANSAVVDNPESSTLLKILFRLWVLDSGATHHLTNDRTLLFNISKLENPIRLTTANGSIVYINETGSVRFTADDSGKEITMHDVGYAPGLAANLISVNRIIQGGATVQFTHKYARISKNNKIVLEVNKKENLYVIPQRAKANVNLIAPVANLLESKQEESLTLWHNRLGHLSLTGVKKLAEGNSVTGLEKLKLTTKDVSTNKSLCEGCIYGKAHRDIFGNSIDAKYQAKDVLDRVHADLYGPININTDGKEVTTIGRGKYVLMIIDEKSRKLFCFILQAKHEAEEHIINWINQVTVELGKPLKKFHSDGGGEFRSTKLLNYFKSKGIKVTVTNKGTPQHNSIVERVNRTINEMATSMIHHGKLSQLFWPEAVMTSVFIRNRCLTTGNKMNKTPEEIWSGTKPSIKDIKVFGCNAYIHIQKEDRDNKFSAKASPAIFLGYDDVKLGYKLLEIESNTIVTSRDVQFDESKFNLALKLVEELNRTESEESKKDAPDPVAIINTNELNTERNIVISPDTNINKNDLGIKKQEGVKNNRVVEEKSLTLQNNTLISNINQEINNDLNDQYDSDGLFDIDNTMLGTLDRRGSSVANPTDRTI
jgi:transposase InsO family protein